MNQPDSTTRSSAPGIGHSLPDFPGLSRRGLLRTAARTAAFRCDTLGVNPGERWDVIVGADNPGVWAFHCHILTHAEGPAGMFGMVNAFIVSA